MNSERKHRGLNGERVETRNVFYMNKKLRTVYIFSIGSLKHQNRESPLASYNVKAEVLYVTTSNEEPKSN